MTNRLAQNTAWMLTARILRTGATAVYFLMVARALGATAYGAFAGVCAMIGIFSPFVSLGAGNLMVRAVSRDRSCFAVRWGHSLLLTLLSACSLVAVTIVFAHFVLPKTIPMMLVFVIALAELLCSRLLDLAGMAFQAIEQLHMTALLTTLLTATRLLAAAWMYFRGLHPDALRWGMLYLLSTLISAAIATWLVCIQIDWPRLSPARRHGEFLEGVYFSLSLSAQTIYNDIDKTMLARLSTLDAAGIYTASYRVIDAAFSPLSAILAASYPRFFQLGSNGLTSTSSLARLLLIRVLAYPIVCGAALYFAASWFPYFVGAQFRDSVAAIQALAPLLLLRTLHIFAADALTGAGFQLVRTAVQVFVAFLNIAANLVVLPQYSWRGAVWTTLGCDGLMALLLWAAVLLLKQREARRLNSSSIETRLVLP